MIGFFFVCFEPHEQFFNYIWTTYEIYVIMKQHGLYLIYNNSFLHLIKAKWLKTRVIECLCFLHNIIICINSMKIFLFSCGSRHYFPLRKGSFKFMYVNSLPVFTNFHTVLSSFSTFFSYVHIYWYFHSSENLHQRYTLLLFECKKWKSGMYEKRLYWKIEYKCMDRYFLWRFVKVVFHKYAYLYKSNPHYSIVSIPVTLYTDFALNITPCFWLPPI
jgi:hypothetical protein